MLIKAFASFLCFNGKPPKPVQPQLNLRGHQGASVIIIVFVIHVIK